MKKLALASAMLGLLGLLAASNTANAADKDDPTGTWKYKVKRGDQEVEQTLKLELKDGKLTGTVGGKQETKIEDGKFKDGEVAFTVTRERNNMKFVSKYTGKVSGDTIKGKIKSERDGKEVEVDWDAKKETK